MTDKEALKLALEVMRNQGDVGVDEWIAAEAAIKQALAAHVQEPVATVQCINGVTIGYLDVMQPVGTKLYTTPPAAQRQWVGLTDEDKLHIEMMGGKSDVMLAEMVETKLKERNV